MPLKGLSLAVLLVLLGLVIAVPSLGLVLLGSVRGEQSLTVLTAVGVLAAGLGGLLFTAGVVAYVFGPAGSRAGAARNHAGYATILGCLYLAAVAGLAASGLYIAFAQFARGAGFLGDGVLAPRGQLRSADFLIAAALAQELAFLGILYFRLVRPGVITWQDMGLTARNLLSRLLLGAPTAVALLGIMGIVAFALTQLGVEQTQQREFESLRDATLPQFVALLVIVGLLTGLAEESFFRGYVFRSLYHARGSWHAYLAGATIFAGAHLDWRAFLPLFAGGLLLSFIYRRTDSIIPGVVAHAINNSVTLAVFYFRVA